MYHQRISQDISQREHRNVASTLFQVLHSPAKALAHFLARNKQGVSGSACLASVSLEQSLYSEDFRGR
jgi:hypothetical protein